MTRTRSEEAAAPPTMVEIDIQSQAENPARESLGGGGGEICPELPLAARIEAVLITTDRPVPESRIAEMLGLSGKGTNKQILAAIQELNAAYEKTGRCFRAERLAGGWQILTLAAFGSVLNRMNTERQQWRLSQPALETLSIIAYRQPIMRAEIEAIRGVASGEVLRGLLERRLVKIVGRAEELGRPMLYGTTKEFLKVFGLSDLDDLPQVQGLSDAGPRPRPDAKPAGAFDATDAAAQQDSASADRSAPEQPI